MAEKVEPTSAVASIIDEEEHLHARVQARAAQDLLEAPTGRSMSADLDEQLISLRDAISEAKPEDLAPLVEQMTRLAALRGQLDNSKNLPIDSQSPYFAHMTLREADRVRDVLIGKRGFIDRRANIQIVDWRNAPISQIYYRYNEGDDFEEEIAGKMIDGFVEIRRNLSISRAMLKRIGSPQGTFVRTREGQWRFASGELNPTLHGGSGSAARAPRPAPKRVGQTARKGSQLGFDFDAGPRADKHLPEIAALIDREQFDLITRPSSGIVAIQGGAGSGKTTVALHRVAYLAFSNKGKARKFLFVVPSQALVRYVQGVLPALGVHGVPVLTYAKWAKTTRQRLIPRSGGKYNDDTPEAVSRVKKNPRIEQAFLGYIDDQTHAFGQELVRLADRAENPAAIIAEWQSRAREPLVPRLRKLAFWLGRAPLRRETANALEGATKRWLARADDLLTDWGELLTDFSRLREAMPDVSESDVRRTVEWTSLQIEAKPGSSVEAIDGRSVDEESPAGCYDPEDDPLLLRLAQLKRGGLFDSKGNETRYQHVAIDEAQDRSAIELRVLLEATEGKEKRNRSITLAGDMAQRVVFDNGIEDWDQLLEMVGLEGTEVSPLAISYRSTAEVMALARQILGTELDTADPLIARSGRPVEIHEFGNPGEAVGFLADSLRSLMGREPTASVAVLARYPEQADVYYKGLARAEVPRLRRVERDDFEFVPGIDVTEVSQVKGLEFDYVILVDVNAGSFNAGREARHLLHIGATRAAHQLWLVTTDTPSPLLPEDQRAIS